MNTNLKLNFSGYFAKFATLLIISFSIFYYSSGLREGLYLHSDEFLTLERSISFDKFDDWLTVYSNNQQCSKKPPLQYWLSAMCMKSGIEGFLSIRIWSYFFFFCLCVGTAMLSKQLSPHNEWAPASSVLLLLSSPELILNSRSGLLDTGMAFFVVLSILSFFKARENDRWWIVCGFSIGFGTLQKAPLAMAIIAFFLFFCKLIHYSDYSWKALWTKQDFKIGFWTAISLSISWPVMQVFRYGTEYVDVAYGKEMFDRFAPGLSSRQPFWSWMEWFWQDWHMIFIFSFASIFIVLISKKWRKNAEVLMLTILILFCCTFLTLASGRIFPRYLTTLVPLISCLTVAVFGDLFRLKYIIFLTTLLFFFSSQDRVELSINTIHKDNTTNVKNICEIFERSLNHHKFIIINRKSIPPGAFGYYVNTKTPVTVIDYNLGLNKKKFKEKLKYPAIGIESYIYEDDLKQLVNDYTIIWSDDTLFIWTVDSP